VRGRRTERKKQRGRLIGAERQIKKQKGGEEYRQAQRERETAKGTER